MPIVTGGNIHGLLIQSDFPDNPGGTYTECFNGFGLATCQTIRTVEEGDGYMQDRTDGYNAIDDNYLLSPWCLDCCSNSRSHLAIDETWLLKCDLTAFYKNSVNKWGYEFRFARNRYLGDSEQITCPLVRSSCYYNNKGDLIDWCRPDNSWLAGYTLNLEIYERSNGETSWRNIESCSVTTIEQIEIPDTYYITINLKSGDFQLPWEIQQFWQYLFYYGGMFFLFSMVVRYLRGSRCLVCRQRVIYMWDLCIFCYIADCERPPDALLEMLGERDEYLKSKLYFRRPLYDLSLWMQTQKWYPKTLHNYIKNEIAYYKMEVRFFFRRVWNQMLQFTRFVLERVAPNWKYAKVWLKDLPSELSTDTEDDSIYDVNQITETIGLNSRPMCNDEHHDVVEVLRPSECKWQYASIHSYEQVRFTKVPSEVKEFHPLENNIFNLAEVPDDENETENGDEMYYQYMVEFEKKDGATGFRKMFFVSDYGPYGLAYDGTRKLVLLWRYSRIENWPPPVYYINSKPEEIVNLDHKHKSYFLEDKTKFDKNDIIKNKEKRRIKRTERLKQILIQRGLNVDQLEEGYKNNVKKIKERHERRERAKMKIAATSEKEVVEKDPALCFCGSDHPKISCQKRHKWTAKEIHNFDKQFCHCGQIHDKDTCQYKYRWSEEELQKMTNEIFCFCGRRDHRPQDCREKFKWTDLQIRKFKREQQLKQKETVRNKVEAQQKKLLGAFYEAPESLAETRKTLLDAKANFILGDDRTNECVVNIRQSREWYVNEVVWTEVYRDLSHKNKTRQKKAKLASFCTVM